MEQFIPKKWHITQEGFDVMDEEARDVFQGIIVTKKVADDHTVIKHDEYGDIHVTPGNYVLTTNKGIQTGTTPQDFESQYTLLKIEIKE